MTRPPAGQCDTPTCWPVYTVWLLMTTLTILPNLPKYSCLFSTSGSASRGESPMTNTRFLCTTLKWEDSRGWEREGSRWEERKGWDSRRSGGRNEMFTLYLPNQQDQSALSCLAHRTSARFFLLSSTFCFLSCTFCFFFPFIFCTLHREEERQCVVCVCVRVHVCVYVRVHVYVCVHVCVCVCVHSLYLGWAHSHV